MKATALWSSISLKDIRALRPKKRRKSECWSVDRLIVLLVTVSRTQAYDVTGRSELHRVLELHVLHEDVVQPVHIRDLLQGVQHHHKETLHEVGLQSVADVSEIINYQGT